MMKSKGQALVEYILIIAIVSIIVITVVGIFGNYLKDTITKVSCSLTDGTYISSDQPGQGKCNK